MIGVKLSFEKHATLPPFMIKSKVSFLSPNFPAFKEQINFEADLIELFDTTLISIVIITYEDVKLLRLSEVTFSKQHQPISFLIDMKRSIEASINTCSYVREI